MRVEPERVLEASGAGVALPGSGGDCCGALHTHAGLTDEARCLAERVMASMPGDAPCSLSEQEYYDVIAFLLDWNELNPDGVVVDADSLEDLALQ